MKKISSCLIPIVFLALFNRFFFLKNQLVSCDEGSIIASLNAYFWHGFFPIRNWHHPPFRYFFFYLSSQLFGKNFFAYRLPSAIFAVLSIFLTYLLTRKFFKTRVALLAALFLTVDPLHTAFSRLAFEESQITFFILLSLFLAFTYEEKKNPFLLLPLGLSLGLGSGTKWLFLPVYLFIALYLFWKQKAWQQPSLLLLLISTLVVLPLATYQLTFLPWLKRGFTFPEWIDFNLRMAKSVTSVSVVDYGDLLGRSSNALFWFFYPLSFSYRLIVEQGLITSVTAFTLPFLWLPFFPSLIYLLTKKENKKITYLSLPFLMYLAPLLFVSRPIFLYSATPFTPFVVIILAAFLERLGSEKPTLKKITSLYATLIVISSLYLFPLEVGYPVPVSLYQPIFSLFWQ